ncbi:MAG: winged helix-turn-helix transcriptional regulator [Nitrosotalea sp.]
MNRSSHIIEVIEKNPGIKFREIMRETGMKNGVLGYYTNKLERDGVIKAYRKARQTRFFPPSVSDNDFLTIKNLRQETPKQILSALLQYEMLSFNDLVTNVKKSPATVSLYLTQLTKDDMVESKFINLKKHHYIKDIEKLRKIIDIYQPGLIERSADRLADNFSSL